MRRSQSGWTFLFFLSALSLAFSQSATTSLRGVVKDPSGALVPGAKISLVNAADGSSMSVVANSAGSYVFPQIPPA
ncbi:MAG: carboxypeptidase-like regulatory domain-containing protein, partial [Terracidiphilus sp.]